MLSYLTVLGQEGGKPNYRRWVLSVLRSIFDAMDWTWWGRKEERRIRPQAEEPETPYLKQDELGRILEAIDSKPPMVQAMFRIATLTPIRRIEIQSLNREDYQRPLLRIKTRKGGEARTLTLDEKTCKLLDIYLATREGKEVWFKGRLLQAAPDVDSALFTSSFGRRMSLVTLSWIFRNLLEELGLYKRGLGWHGVRRGVATMLHKAGISERELQQYGGWRSPTMVHRYVQLEPPEVEEKVRQKHPLIKR